MKKTAILLILMTTVLGACQILNLAKPTATPIPPTPTPPPPKELTVCLGNEPESLYLYAAVSQAASDVLQAILDGPIDVINGEPVPVILEKVPGLADGSAYLSPVGVTAGDEVINTAGDLVSLQAGVQVFPTGCSTAACALTWDGTTPLQMDQLTATYKLKPGLVWSDGQPLKASDSIFSFKIASDPATPADSHAVDQTDAYTATDDLTVQWVSKPGLVTETFAPYFWLPLPEHTWGSLSAVELLASEEANRSPLGWGPFMLESWTSGESLRLITNPAYFRAGEGLPYFDIITFKFITAASGAQSLKDFQGCDIVSDSALDVASMGAIKAGLEGSGYKLVTWESGNLELLAFGITPASYDDNYYPYGADRPDIFGDVRTRQAIAACIDQQAITTDLVYGLAQPAAAWVTSDNALMEGLALKQYAYDPAAAIALLNEAGWRDIDLNPSTPLAHGGDARIPFGTPLEMTLLSSTAPLQAAIAGKIAADLGACGIAVTVAQLPVDELFQSAPDGKIFGRAFDLALIPWETASEFNCAFFETAEIPTSGNYWLGSVTGGVNFYGYSNPAFDTECGRMQTAGLDNGLYHQSGDSLLNILATDVPFIPLFHFPQGYLIRDNLCLPVEINRESGLFSGIEAINESGSCQ